MNEFIQVGQDIGAVTERPRRDSQVQLRAARDVGPKVASFSVDGEEFIVVSHPIDENGVLDVLTEAERHVAMALLDGKSNMDIASSRGSSPRTVANQIVAVYRKLGIVSRAELSTLVHRARRT